MRALRPLFVLVALVVIGVGAAVAVWNGTHRPGPGAVRSTGEAVVGGPFSLVDQDGRRVDQRLLNGKWSVVFFGFTYCPDVCPTTRQMLTQAIDQLGPAGDRVQVVFFSVDPERDTPAQLKTYLTGQGMPRRVIGLTGTPAEVAGAARAYRVFYQRAGEAADYTVNHSTVAYLMNPRGRFVRVLAYGLTPEETARQIREAMRE